IAFIKAVLKTIGWLVKVVISMFVAIWDTQGDRVPLLAKEPQSEKTLTPYEQELHNQIKTKIDEPLFETSIRLAVNTSNSQTANERIKGFIASLSPFATAYQRLEVKSSILSTTSKEKRFLSRELPLFNNPVLTASELADLYHFPDTGTTQTEDLVK